MLRLYNCKRAGWLHFRSRGKAKANLRSVSTIKQYITNKSTLIPGLTRNPLLGIPFIVKDAGSVFPVPKNLGSGGLIRTP
jgi:hypothetical protein